VRSYVFVRVKKKEKVGLMCFKKATESKKVKRNRKGGIKSSNYILKEGILTAPQYKAWGKDERI